MFKFLAKLVGLEGWPRSKPQAETGQERFNRTEAEEKRLAEERQQANLRRMAERNKKTETSEEDMTEGLKRFENEGNQN